MSEAKRILVLQPFSKEFDVAYGLLRHAAEGSGVRLMRIDQIAVAGSLTEQIYELIHTSDLVICDITHRNPNVMYELGYAHALRKPVLLIAQQSETTPFDVRSVRILYYDLDPSGEINFVHSAQRLIAEAIRSPALFSVQPHTETAANTIFISYSHRDSEFLARLRVHLRPLEREGRIELWDDTKLKAGDQWKASIEEALGRARVAILLISADFLASEFIVNNELPPLLKKAESEGTQIIPIVVKPCRFRRDKDLGKFQAINDPSRPLLGLPEEEQEKVFDRISEFVERAMEV